MTEQKSDIATPAVDPSRDELLKILQTAYPRLVGVMGIVKGLSRAEIAEDDEFVTDALKEVFNTISDILSEDWVNLMIAEHDRDRAEEVAHG
jgi:hypothetical protein